MKSTRRTLLLLLLIAGGASRVGAQMLENHWQILARFDHRVTGVHFLDLPGPPRVGFAGTNGMVYRTTDGGTTWRTTLSDDYHFDARDFTFKDSLTGWFANYCEGDTSIAQCFKTTDGGASWSAIHGPARVTSSILYRPKQNLLLLAAWNVDFSTTPLTRFIGKSCYSTDDGNTWTVFYGSSDINGFAFINDTVGIATSRNAYIRTTDGGFTWRVAAKYGDETWQPLADKAHGYFWAASEIGPDPTLVFRSKDNGNHFDDLIYPMRDYFITGTMRMGPCGPYYIQSQKVSANGLGGMLQSADGENWAPLADASGFTGPANGIDTRFYVKGSYVYAGGGDGLAGDSTALWRYVGDSTKYDGGNFVSPQASTRELSITAASCENLDSSFYTVYINDCVDAQLISAVVEPPDHFVVFPFAPLPYSMRGNRPIRVEYRPHSASPDTALLVLAYQMGTIRSFDTVRLIGALDRNPTGPAIDLFVNQSKSAAVHPGDTISVDVRMMNAIPGSSGVDSIEFQTSFDTNILSYLTMNVAPPWSLAYGNHLPGSEAIGVQHLPGIDVAANSEIVRIFYKAYLAPAKSTRYTFTHIQFNDSLLAGCVQATALLQPTSITVSACGDSLIRSFLVGNPLALRVETLPDGGQALHVECNSPLEASVEIDNVLGMVVGRTAEIAVNDGTQSIPLPTAALPNGLYFVRLVVGDRSIAAGRFVKVN